MWLHWAILADVPDLAAFVTSLVGGFVPLGPGWTGATFAGGLGGVSEGFGIHHAFTYSDRGRWRAESQMVSQTRVDLGVTSGVRNVAFEGGDGMEKGGVGRGIVVKLFSMGDKASQDVGVL